MKRFTKRLKDGGIRLNIADYGEPPYPLVTNEFVEKLAAYEDTELSPEEFKESVDFVLELNAKVHKVIKDLKYYLDTNEENGVVYIPKFVIEKMIDENLKTNF
jgi:hypothetical protein